MVNQETAKRGIDWILVAVALDICALIAGGFNNKVLFAILHVTAFIFHYRGLSGIREFHPDYIKAFRCLILNIVMGVAVLVLGVVLAFFPKMLVPIVVWIDILVERVAVPVLTIGEMYFLCTATGGLTADAGYGKTASLGVTATALYVSGAAIETLVYLPYLFCGSGILHTVLAILVLLGAGISLIGYTLVMVFLFQARTRLG